jgi:hypothetical protein
MVTLLWLAAEVYATLVPKRVVKHNMLKGVVM